MVGTRFLGSCVLGMLALACAAGCNRSADKSKGSSGSSADKAKESTKSEPKADKPEQAKKNLHLVLALDVSGSMYEEDGTKSSRIKRLQAAVQKGLDKLNASDKVAVIAWAYNALLLLPPTPMSSKAKVQGIIKRIDMFDVDPGGTSLDKALQIALNQIDRKGADARYAILVVTDGETSGEPACLQLAKDARSKGVHLTVIGLSKEVNTEFLKELATLAGGRFDWIDSKQAKEMDRVLLEEFAALVSQTQNK